MAAAAALCAVPENAIQFKEGSTEVIRLDAEGFHYRGQFIADAGEAHRLLVEFLKRHQTEVFSADER
jgi:hypothetical protein